MTDSPHPPDYEAFGGWVDAYRNCEKHCNHDLSRGVLINDLLNGDGPYTRNLLAKLYIPRGAEYGEIDPPNVTQLEASPSTPCPSQGGEHEGID